MSLVQNWGIYFGHVNKMPKHFDVPMVSLNNYALQGDQHVRKVHTAHAFIVCWNNFGKWNSFHFVDTVINWPPVLFAEVLQWN